MSNTTGDTFGAGSASPSGAPHIRQFLVVNAWFVLCTLVFLLVFFVFYHDVVSLFLTYKFECPLISYLFLLFIKSIIVLFRTFIFLQLFFLIDTVVRILSCEHF